MKDIQKYLNEGWFPILCTGTHTDRRNKQHSFDSERLNDIVKKYDKRAIDFSLAPLQATHDTNPGTPNLGKIEKLKVIGNFLLAKPAKVMKEAIKVLKDLGYRYISSSLSHDNTLNHVALVQKAAVGGLGEFPEASLNFSQSEDASIFMIEFSIDGQIENDPDFEEEIQNKTQPEKEVKMSDEKTPGEEKPDKELDTEKPGIKEESKKEPADFSAALQKISTLEGKLSEMEKEKQQKEAAEFCASLEPGVITPVMLPRLKGLLFKLGNIEEKIEFSGPDGKDVTESPAESFKTFLKSLKPQIPLEPLNPFKGSVDGLEFSADVPDDDLDLDKRATAIQTNEKISYAEALKKARRM